MPFFLKKRKSRFSLGSSGSSDASFRANITPPTASPTVTSYDSSISSEGRPPHTRLVQLPAEAYSGDSRRSAQYAPSDLAFSGLRVDQKLRVIVVGTGFGTFLPVNGQVCSWLAHLLTLRLLLQPACPLR